MAKSGYYLEALLQFEKPASVREIHDKAREMFGEEVKGDRSSCRLSLDRQVMHGRAEKLGSKYSATRLGYDPISELATKIRVLENKVRQLESERDALSEEAESLRSQVRGLQEAAQ